ncbi:YbjQ family protein [Arhodomonas sp. AD133]|uniref:YbjQ family protein n=1 Tax=Arhodomonas sp. AD133 TaxID=3415009 RepID=UPI003EBE447D
MIDLIIFVTLLAIGFGFGTLAERRHYRSIRRRERDYGHLLVLTGMNLPPAYINHDSELVKGNVVVSTDYFKVVAAGLKQLIGGRLGMYESLLDRGRREAILRMQTEAAARGAVAVVNMKFETSRLSGNAKRGLGAVEVLAYGTALMPPR